MLSNIFSCIVIEPFVRLVPLPSFMHAMAALKRPFLQETERLPGFKQAVGTE